MTEETKRTLGDLGDSLAYRHNAKYIIAQAKDDGLDREATEKRLSAEFNKSAHISASYNAYIGLGGALVATTLFSLAPIPGIIGFVIATSILFSAVKGTLGTLRLTEHAFDEKFGKEDSRYKRITQKRASKQAQKALKKYF